LGHGRQKVKAVLVRQPGGPEQLAIGEVPTPVPAAGELLVRVRAAALNRADILQRQGNYPPPPGASDILGLDVAGVVEEAGPGCRERRSGDRVCGLLPGGGYAQYAVLPEALAIPIPEGWSFEQAASIPEVFLTAYQTLFWIGRLVAGERVLIHAGAGGVGSAAIQLAREAGAAVLATAGSDPKCEACRELGAATAINYRQGPFAEEVLKATGGEGVDLILDFVAAPYFAQNLSILRPDGRLVLISTLGGGTVENLKLGNLIARRLQISGTTLRSRSTEYKARLTRDLKAFALERFARGVLKPVVDRLFPWEQVADAHRYMEANRNTGKIVLAVE
jgi:tumor protein p53-inducible protein 3